MSSRVRNFDERKANRFPKKKTLQDVKKAKAKVAEAQKEWTARMQADLSNELKQIKTQQQLTNIEEMVNAYGSAQNRAEFNQLQSAFKKEARALIDMELETMKSKEQLESIRSMVELNGSQAQKERFAQFESYYKKRTWQKYMALHGKEYTAPVSGVGEADRRAQQIISENNLKKMAEEAKKADKVMTETAKALEENAQMEEFLKEGDKLIEQGKKAAQNVKPEVPPTPPVPPHNNPGVIKPETLPVKYEPHKPVSITPVIEQEAHNVSKLSKFLRKGAKGLLLAAAAGVVTYLGYKAFSGDSNKTTNVQSNNNLGFVPKDSVSEVSAGTSKMVMPVVSDSTNTSEPVDSTKFVIPAMSDSTEVSAKDSTVTGIPVVSDSTGVIKPDSASFVIPTVSDSTSITRPDSARTVIAPDSTRTQVVTNPTDSLKTKNNEITDVEIAQILANGENIDNAKFYVVKKGDCVWRLIEKRLKRNSYEYNAIKEFLTEKYGKVPTHNGIILYATKLTCELNGIRYIIDDKKLMPGDVLNVPKLDTAA